MSGPDSKSESLSIPVPIRHEVDARDRRCCRVCGKYLGERRSLHHIEYGGDAQGMGGRRKHVAEEIVTVCWLPGDGDCHSLVHSDKGTWQPILREVVQRPSVTAFQVQRWQLRRMARP